MKIIILDKSEIKKYICANCGKDKGSHLANTQNCPLGKPGRAGQTSYYRNQFFVEKQSKRKSC